MPRLTLKPRSWQFTAGVDDAASECALDNCSWDVTVENGSANSDEDGSGVSLQDQLDALERRIRSEMEMLCR